MMMTTEEKAKAYDEAIERAKEMIKAMTNIGGVAKVDDIQYLFPELKESEDERIRKALIDGFTVMKESKNCNKTFSNHNIPVVDILAWLEKQCEQKPTIEMKTPEESLGIDSDTYNKIVDEYIYGEQKPADKVEPKFREGDWVVLSTSDGEKVVQVDFIEYFKSGEPIYVTSEGRWFDNRTKAHLWTIQDAKDGDVLFTSSTASHETFIFKSIDEKGNAKCYFAYDSEDGFREGKYHFIGSATNCKPATKEQYDTLMKAMTDAGYTFNFEKKELKKEKVDNLHNYLYGEQKPTDKVEPKFREGEWVINTITKEVEQVIELTDTEYICSGHLIVSFTNDDLLKKWTIQDAKDGDVLVNWNNTIYLFKGIEEEVVKFHCFYNTNREKFNTPFDNDSHLGLTEPQFEHHPATKEQRDLLFQKIKEAGYTWDADKKKLVKDEITIKAGRNYRCTKTHIYAGLDWLEGTKYYADEDYSLVNNGCTCFCPKYSKYEHNNLFEEVEYDGCIEKQCEKNPTWSKEDEKEMGRVIYMMEQLDLTESWSDCYTFLNSLKDRMQSKQEWKQENTGDLTDFENAMMHIGGSFFGDNAGLDPNDTNAIKEQANLLLELVPKQKWSEEDEETLKDIITSMTNLKDSATSDALRYIYNSKIDWLKSLKYRYTWKPSEEEIVALEHAINCYSCISPTNTNEVFTLEIMKERLKNLTK